MSQIAVIGAAGGGKSTLCRELSRILGIAVFQLDKVQWRPGWTPAPNSAVDEAHDRVMIGDRWIIDGFGTAASIGRRFAAADTIIVVDHAAWRHYWWAFKRQIKGLLRHNPDMPEGCSIGGLWKLVFIKGIPRVRRETMPRVIEQAKAHADHAAVYHVRSARDFARICAAAHAFAKTQGA
jgi:adenylate kinase family enzyme